MDRRELIGWMMATGGLAVFSQRSAAELLAMGADAHRAPQVPQARVMDAHAALTVQVAAALIIPATDTPGATEAGVAAFIERMLDQWYPADDRDRFLAGVAELDGRARARGQPDFVTAGAADQVAMLQHFDDAVTALREARDPSANQRWFAMLKYLTVWGYCTSEPGMRDTLHTWPMPMHYDGNARVGA
ncbi:MAG: gluconate 2-dehydrogenase subunit 3 family protein [Gemmatimonadaceae bacterium]|nr:gluconate 2-dehydrogenase subunit 3 family protein [Gemmatimonadaceae bacterium]